MGEGETTFPHRSGLLFRATLGAFRLQICPRSSSTRYGKMQDSFVLRFLPGAIVLSLGVNALAAEPDEVPAFLNPEMVHVSVESADPKGYLSICPNVCELAGETLLLAYHRTTRVDFSGEYSTWTRISRDGGKNWSGPRLVEKQLQAPGLLTLPSGEVLLNGCTVINDRWSTTMRLFHSTDSGQHWAEQHPIWEKSKGIRLQGGCASLIRLSSGRIVCPVFGTDIVAADYGAATEQMTAWCYYSDDEGKTWKWKRHLEKEPSGSYHYPTVIQTHDGTIHTIYSYFVKGGKSMKHSVFNEAWVQAQ